MKIGIITDIHANVVALKAVLQRFESEGVTGIICCGDMVGIGPRPKETVRIMMSLDNLLGCVRGNHEEYLLGGLPETVPNPEGMEEGEIAHHLWQRNQLGAEEKEFLASLPYWEEKTICGKKFHIAHYALNEANHCVNYTPNPTFEEAEKMFAGVQADIVLYGHDHAPTVNHQHGKWYINTGSLGCPMKGQGTAQAGLFTIEGDKAEYRQLAVPYDMEAVIKDIRARNYPDKDAILTYFYGVE